MKLPSSKVIGSGILCLTCGVITGLLIPQDGIRSSFTSVFERLLPMVNPEEGDHADEDEHADEAGHDDHDHVELSKAAQKSLNLKRLALSPTSYTATTAIPSIIVERPAISDLHVVTEFEGIIEEIKAVPGQAVREGDELFRIRLTGDALASAQSAFLDAVQAVDILNQEIARLEKAAQDGGLARKSLIELEYEKKRLVAQQETKRQELMIRGLTTQQIDNIVETRTLIRDVVIKVPSGLIDLSDSPMPDADPWTFTIEELLVTPGLLVHAGDPLGNLAYHASLYLEALAFERDVDAVAKLLESQAPLHAELGEDRHPIDLKDLRIVHLSNHVEADSQAYPFYLELGNQILQDNVREDGRRFRSWKFKPGQRGHVSIPHKSFQGIFKVPAEAVVLDGLENIVFRKEAAHDHDHGDHEGHDHEEHEEMDAFEPVPVVVLHKDRRFAVLSTDGELRPGNVIAANAAYQILLATKSGEGGGHHHDHDH